MKGRTSIVIAHRLSAVRNLDRILVFDRGEIVEQGTHGSLTRAGGIYRWSFERQASGRVSAASELVTLDPCEASKPDNRTPSGHAYMVRQT